MAAAATPGQPTWSYVLIGVAVVLGPVITALVLLRKAPAEARKITVDTVDVNVKVAGDLRDDALEDRKTAREELAVLRSEFLAYKAEQVQYKADVELRLTELATELRGKVAENTHLKAELRLRDQTIADRDRRIGVLEAEVRELKGKVARLENPPGNTPHS